jgi:lipopolysaccharide/colanic/teichoic acid biosynthesis glycosyltransferase
MQQKRITRWVLTADLLWMFFAFLAAGCLRYGPRWILGSNSRFNTLLPFLVAGMVLWTVLFRRLHLEGSYGAGPFGAMASRLLLGLFCLMGGLLATGYLARQYVSRLVLAYFAALLFLGFVLLRHFVLQWLRALHRTGEVSRIVVVGSGTVARELALKIERHPEMLCEIVGFLSPDGGPLEGSVRVNGWNGIRRFSTLGIADFLKARNIHEVVIALSQPTSAEIHTLAKRCREMGIRVSLVPQPYDLYLCRPTLHDLDGLPLLQLEEIVPSPVFDMCKRILDLTLGGTLFVLAIPIVFPAAIVLRIKKGAAFCWDTRCGQHGHTFPMLRLNVPRRSPKATAFEQLLEDLSITEIPQLWNVLRGQMSLIGPRPESPIRAQHYTEWQQRRLTVRPGITGLAQVHGLRDFNSSEDKARYDLQYLLQPSALVDAALLLQTVWILIQRAVHFAPCAPESKPPQSMRSMPNLREEVGTLAHRPQPRAD